MPNSVSLPRCARPHPPMPVRHAARRRSLSPSSPISDYLTQAGRDKPGQRALRNDTPEQWSSSAPTCARGHATPRLAWRHAATHVLPRLCVPTHACGTCVGLFGHMWHSTPPPCQALLSSPTVAAALLPAPHCRISDISASHPDRPRPRGCRPHPRSKSRFVRPLARAAQRLIGDVARLGP